MDEDEVIATARSLMDRSKPPRHGYSDVGEVLTDWLRGLCTDAEAMERLSYLKQDFDQG